MESGNRIIALLLGLLVVLFIVAAVLGKVGFLNIKGPIAGGPVGKALGLRQPSPTPVKKVVKKETEFVEIKEKSTSEKVETSTSQNTVRITTPTGIAGVSTGSTTTKGGQPVTTIPETGVPILLYPLASLGLATGLYLRRKSY